jgi:hypothetical protein
VQCNFKKKKIKKNLQKNINKLNKKEIKNSLYSIIKNNSRNKIIISSDIKKIYIIFE